MAGGDTVCADILPSVVDRDQLGQRNQAALRDGVGDVKVGAGQQSVDRRNVDNRPAAAGCHARYGVLADQRRSLQIDVESEVPVRLFDFGNHAVARPAHIVDNHVKTAVALDALRREPVAVLFDGNISDDDGGRSAAALDSSSASLRLCSGPGRPILLSRPGARKEAPLPHRCPPPGARVNPRP